LHYAGNLVWGIILVLVGVWFLAMQFVPGFGDWVAARVSWERSWPLIIIGVAVLQAVIGLTTRTPGLAVPATIIGGIGGLLYWQNATGNWDTWAWTWGLIPGFVGLGLILMTAFGGNRSGARAGVILVIISALLTGIFGSFLGGPSYISAWWPVTLILLGAWVLIRPRLGRK